MKASYYFLLMICVLLLSCNREVKKDGLIEIAVDIDQNFSLPLSEIADETIAIELELTSESLINPDRIQSVLLTEDVVIMSEADKIFAFDNNGKFVRTIGSKGQGPGEFTGIRLIAVDNKNKYVYVIALINKIICYDLTTGNFLKESYQTQQLAQIKSIRYINDEFLLLSEQSGNDEKGLFKLSALYRLNREFQIADSVIIRMNHFGQAFRFATRSDGDFILSCNSNLYVYCPENYPDMSMSSQFQVNPSEVVLRDTLYRLENNFLIPELKLKFKNNGIDEGGNKFISLYNIYRSSRYIFAYYRNSLNKNNEYLFCYDTKTGKGYNMQSGYTDDIHNIEKRVSIRPLNTDTEVFYYWHTNMKPGDKEEPNPTLYIGKLKK